MADYFPLLARALDTMSDRGPDMRRLVYERARSALLTQLRTLDPPLGEAEIERERLALEDAVTRAEAVYGDGAPPPPAETPPEPEPAAVAEEPVPDAGERPRVEPRPAIRRGRSRNRSLTLAVGLVVVMIPVAVVGWLWRDRPAPQPQPTAQATQTAPAPAPEPSGDSKFADRIGGPAPTQPVPTQSAPSMPAAQPQTSQPAQLSPPTAPSAAPSAPVPSPAAQAPATSAPAAQSPATPTPAAPSAPAPTAPAAPAQPELAVAQRAVLIQENTADPQNPKVTAGRTLWRLDALNSGQGQPLETVVRANVDLPEAGLSLTMVIRRNSDATFPASHTIELTFTPADPTNQDRIARDVGLPQLKPDDTQRGTPLAGLSVPVKENIFLIGLSDLKGDIERNTDLLLHRNLIDLPVRFASGQRAVISFEKGVSGDRVVTEAFRQWAATP